MAQVVTADDARCAAGRWSLALYDASPCMPSVQNHSPSLRNMPASHARPTTLSLTRRDFMRAGVASLPVLVAPQLADSAEPARKPNILFVFADQLRAHTLSCYGNGQVHTPNFDRIAGEGVRFDNALSTWPVCSPYRAMLLTGRYPMHNGAVTNDTALMDGLPTIATVCKANGYDTGYIGKWHLEWGRDPFVPKERRQGFDYWAVRNCSHQHFGSFYCGDTPERVPLPGYEPDAQAKLASDYIRQHKDRPFCLFMSWGPPHDPYRGPEEQTKQFPVEELRLRRNVPESEVVHRLLATDPSRLSERNASRRANRRKTLEDDRLFKERCLQGYYAATKAIDDSMGTVLRALDDTGLSDDTILVFASDHGDMMGSHRMISKQMPLEESIRIPFVLRYPRGVAAGTTTDALLSPVDVMPTLLSLAGIEAPSGVDGKGFREAAEGGRSDQRDAVLIMKLLPGGNPWLANGVTTWRGVRTKRYTYAYLLDRGPWVLFDNRADPYQLSNLIDRPEHAALQKRLHERTQELMKEADDPGDDKPIVDFRLKRKGEHERKKPVRKTFRLKQGDKLPRRDAPQIANRPFRITATVEVSGANGVIVAQGGIGSGFSLYLANGKLTFATRHKGPLARVQSKEPLPEGRVKVEAELTKDAQLRLSIDGQLAASGNAPGLIPKLPGDGLEVGADELHAVDDYRCPNRFQGKVQEVVIELGD